MVFMMKLNYSGRVDLKENSFALEILNLKGIHYFQEVRIKQH
jgi:hypothetical protein